MKQKMSAALAYLAIAFPLAVLWHMVAFRDLYESLGFFGAEEPKVALGFLSILVQGVLISWAFPFFKSGESSMVRALRYSLLFGAFLWTSHVIAFAAKHPLSSLSAFIGVETLYLVLQFTLYGVVLGWIFGSAREKGESAWS